MKVFYSISAYVLVALGTGHTLLTPVFYLNFSADALWFAGTGLSLLLLGVINIIAMRLQDRALGNICVAANLIGVVFLTLVLLAVPEVQALFAVLAALGAVVGSISTQLVPRWQTQTGKA